MVEQSKSTEQDPKRRRSTRIVHAVPVAVAGEDALGQPFKERTSTLIVSCHGCRYQSKHYVPRNGVVELEVQHPEPGHSARRVRARVSWIQRPRTVRELFQVGVEIAVPGNVWGVAFPPDDWFPWPEEPSSESAITPAATLPSSIALESVPSLAPVIEDLTPAPEAVPLPPPVSEKVRTMPRPEPPPVVSGEPSEAAVRQVQNLVADARRQIQEDVKKIVAAVVNSEGAQITSALTSQMRGAATEAVKQALMSHGQVHAERLDVALRESLARLEIVRYEAARAMKEQSEIDTKTVTEASANTQRAAESALAEALARLESAREETARALSMQSRAESQRVMAQSASRIEDLMRQSIDKITEAGSSSSERLTQAARAEMQHHISGALESLRAEIAATTGEVRRLSGEELETARKQLDSAREQIAMAAQTATQQALKDVDARVETTRTLLGDLAREAGELDTAISQKLGAGRGEWQAHVDRELASARIRWEELVAQSLAGSTESLRAKLEEASAVAAGPAIENFKGQIEAQAAAAQEALDSVQAEAGHAVTRMRESAADAEGQSQRAALAAQRTFGELETALEARAAAARASVDALRAALDSAAANAQAARGSLDARAAELQGGLESLRATLEGEGRKLESLLGNVREAQERVQSTIGELDAARGSATERIRRELDEGLHARALELDERVGKSWREFEAKTAPALEAASRDSLDKFRRALESEIQSVLAPELERAKAAAAGLEAGEQHADKVLNGFRERLQELTDGAVRDTGALLRERITQMEREFSESGREATARMLSEIEEKADDTTHKTFEALYKASEWYQKKTQTSLQSAMDRALEQTLGALREKAGEMSSLFASELEHFSRSYAEHTRALLEEAASTVKKSAQGEIEVATEAARTHVVEETRRLAEQQVDRAKRATEFMAGEVIARVYAQAHDAEAAAGNAAVRSIEQLEERAARTRDDMERLHSRATSAFADHLTHEVAESLVRAQGELDRSLEPILERWRTEREELHEAWKSSLGELGRTALDEHREHLSNVANSLMVTTVASLSEHSQTILDQLARDAELRVRQNCVQVFAGLGEVLQERLGALASEFAPGAGDQTSRGTEKSEK